MVIVINISITILMRKIAKKTITLSSNHIFRTGIQERGDDDIQDDERNVDGGLLELQQTHR